MVLNAFKTVLFEPSPFDLRDLEDFPYDQYNDQMTRYQENERWFTGQALEDQPDSVDKADLYPLRINPIVGTVLKHAHILFGEPEEDARMMVYPKLLYTPGNKADKRLAQEAENVLNGIWWESHGKALLIESAIYSQIYGGCVLKATYSPWESVEYGGLKNIPITIEAVNPKDFVGIPFSGDKFRLADAWFLKIVSKEEAELYGYTGDQDEVWFVEHWTEKEYEQLIDGKTAVRNGQPLKGANPFGFIPAVYIPHIRIGDFLGINAYQHLVGLVKELNRVWGDIGDAVNDDSHPIVIGMNIPASVQEKKVNEFFKYFDIGSANGLSASDNSPDMKELNTTRTSETMTKMTADIMAQYNRDAFVPPVAYGEDEGSQRSGLTLQIRFHPLTSHASIERYFWTSALDVFQRYILLMCLKLNLGEINKRQIGMRIKQVWAPMLPKDRDALVTEWGVRSSNTIASVEKLIELAGDVEDIDEERERILQWIVDVEEAKAKATAKYEMQLQEKQLEGQKEIAEENREAFAERQDKLGAQQKKPAAPESKESEDEE